MRVIRPIQKVIDAFESLPGIGPKSAARLAYYLLRVPQERLERFGAALARLRLDAKVCRVCNNIGEEDLCPICQDNDRDKALICVVEEPLDLIAFERGESYKGLYHVLGGAINPLARIGPEELSIEPFLSRLQKGEIKEVILATNPSMEGEATAMYLANRIEDLKKKGSVAEELLVTRIGRGLPTGAEVEYADSQTLSRALESRQKFD